MDYAQIINGVVNMIVVENEQILNELRSTGLTIIDITSLDPKPSSGWTYNGTVFSPPIFSFAKIINNLVDSIINLTEDAAQEQRDLDIQLVNLQYMSFPEIGWTYENGTFRP